MWAGLYVGAMPRSKTFSVDEAIEKATTLFLERGYAALSMRIIGEALGLSRATVYTTFGNKLRLFVTVLERYGPARLPGLPELRDSSSPRAAIKGLFALAIRGGAAAQRCLVLATIMELPDSEPPIVRLIDRAVVDLESCLRTAIERGQAAGKIADGVDPVQAARVLLSLYLGVYVLVRSKAPGAAPVFGDVMAQVEALLPAPAEQNK